MPAATYPSEAIALNALEEYAVEIRDFLEALPQRLDREPVDQLCARCRELLDHIPKPTQDERWIALRDRMQELMSDLHAGLAARWQRSRVLAVHEELCRTYESWLAAARNTARTIGTPAPAQASLQPLIRARTIFHVGMGVFAVSLYQFLLTRTQAIAILWTVLGIAICLEISRRFSPRFNHVLLTSPVFRPIARPREYYRVNSATYYLAALSIITPLFSRPAVMVAALVLAVGDPAAAWAGRRWGRRKIVRRKSIVGTVVFLLSAFVVATSFLMIFQSQVGWNRALFGAAIASCAGAIAELISGRVDDNFTIPIAAVLAGALIL